MVQPLRTAVLFQSQMAVIHVVMNKLRDVLYKHSLLNEFSDSFGVCVCRLFLS